MKKILKYIYLILITLILTFQQVNALTFEIEEGTSIIIYLFCGIFILVGIVIILISRTNSSHNKSYYEEEHKHEISGLVDKEKIDENKNFNPDSIFKIIPTFSKNKFFETTFKELKEKDKIDDRPIEKKIINFKDEKDKYVITSIFTFERKVKNDKNEDIKEKINYTVTSVNNKDMKDNFQCPTCGGKIKDITKLRCKHCGNILPKIETNNNEWIIEKFEK